MVIICKKLTASQSYHLNILLDNHEHSALSLSSLCECVSAFVCAHASTHVTRLPEEKMNKEQSEHSNRLKTCTKRAHYFLAVEKSHNNLA